MTEREPIRIPCEGSGCPTATMQVNAMCAMCGRVRMLDDDGRVVDHDRDDVLAMLKRGDYG